MDHLYHTLPPFKLHNFNNPCQNFFILCNLRLLYQAICFYVFLNNYSILDIHLKRFTKIFLAVPELSYFHSYFLLLLIYYQLKKNNMLLSLWQDQISSIYFMKFFDAWKHSNLKMINENLYAGGNALDHSLLCNKFQA